VKQCAQEGFETVSASRVLLIINIIRSRQAAKQLAEMEASLEALGVAHDTWFTEHKGHGAELANRAVSEGYATVVAVGGDGTVNEVVNGTAGSGITVAALPLGSNNDFLRSLGVWTWQQACEVVAQGVERQLDLGLAEYHDQEGQPTRRYYAVLADVGLGSEVVRNTPRRFRHSLGGGLGYVISLYRTAIQGQARARMMRVQADGVLRYQQKLLLVEALNGSYAGGGLKVAPRASLDDGLLDVFVAEDLHWLKIWALFPKIYRGTHVEHEKTGYFQAQDVEVDTETASIVSVDGEVVGYTPARFCVMPGLLRVRCPRPADDAG
jgi:diacylglycerol kinase (ATP)